MAGKKIFMGMLAAALTFGVALSGCASISKENNGSFQTISVPAKDFTSLGLIFTENMIENSHGQVFTYNELLKQAKALGADAIVNVVIDVKREGTRFLFFYLNPKETWYGSATAIKYTTGTIRDVTTNNTDGTTVTKEGVIMSGTSGGGGLLGGGGGAPRKKFLGIF